MLKKGILVTIVTSYGSSGSANSTNFLCEDPELIEAKVRKHVEATIKDIAKQFKEAKKGEMVFRKNYSISVELTNYVNLLEEEEK